MVHLAGSTACTVDADCRESLIELYMAIDSHYLSAVDPLEGGERSWSWWVEHYEGYSEDKPPYEKCVERVREQEKAYRRRGWVWLPMCFDISGRNGLETRLEVHDTLMPGVGGCVCIIAVGRDLSEERRFKEEARKAVEAARGDRFI
ncbi:hypothetical protein K466DRAFT_602839 [Polyporus arcularius HHB13444]|uniref:Uncharacterized protein n=1 Tax=Polyporus arcularius HHB13444 TaxID=1314778 RepID=A0A5C3P1U6_9APHY|nr:hypothetical protein K466DRAFT_602839 [Polyporus arcularius HHB13444]